LEKDEKRSDLQAFGKAAQNVDIYRCKYDIVVDLELHLMCDRNCLKLVCWQKMDILTNKCYVNC